MSKMRPWRDRGPRGKASAAVRRGWRSAVVAVFASGAATACLASENDPSAPAALRQCGDCHMVFPPQMLPMRSWILILSSLDDHFGEVASVPSEDLEAIRDYLTAHSADSPTASARDRHYFSELLPDSAPMRITRTPWWNQMHADFDFDGVKRGNVKSPANCLACHPRGVR